jgi:dynein assembly factor 5
MAEQFNPPGRGSAVDQDYELFLHSVVRDINGLSEKDRNVRREALKKLERAFVSKRTASVEVIGQVFVQNAHKPLLKCLSDSIEKCRELALQILKEFVKVLSERDLLDVLALLLAAIVQRFKTLPFPEESEEIRLELLELLRAIVRRLASHLGVYSHDLLDALAKAMTDPSPETKRVGCELVADLVAALPSHRLVSAAGTKSLLSSLLQNLTHQRWKVRKATIEALRELVSDPELLGTYLEDIVPIVSKLLADEHTQVRLALAKTLHLWLLRGIKERKEAEVDVNADNSADDDKTVRQFFTHVGQGDWESRLLYTLLSLAGDDVDVVPLVEELAAAKLAKVKELAADRKSRHEVNEFVALVDEAGLEVKDMSDSHPLRMHPGMTPSFRVSAPPSPVLSWYMKHHVPTILPRVLPQIVQWTSSLRSGAARLLLVVLALGHKACLPFADSLLAYIYKAKGDDDEIVLEACEHIATFLGLLDVDALVDIVTYHLTSRTVGEDVTDPERYGRVSTRVVGLSADQDAAKAAQAGKRFTATTDEARKAVLAVLAGFMTLQTPTPGLVVKVTDLLETQLQHLPELATVCAAVLRDIPAVDAALAKRLFGLLVRAQASGVDVEASMARLASLSGLTVAGLYEVHLASFLDDVVSGPLWEEDIQRQLLESLVKCSSQKVVAPELARLLPLIAAQADPESASTQARIDLLALVHHLLELDAPEVRKAWMTGEAEEDSIMIGCVMADIQVPQTYALSAIRTVMCPNATWRSGNANQRIRKGALVCINLVLESRLLGANEVRSLFNEILPTLKMVLDDSWSPDNRLIATLVLGGLLSAIARGDAMGDLDGEVLRDVYPELLKRLDDSNDAIRQAICHVLQTFFEILGSVPKWGDSLYQYILKQLFIHLDDPSTEMQAAMSEVLRRAVHVNPSVFKNEAQSAASRSCHPRACEELVRLAETLVSVEDF